MSDRELERYLGDSVAAKWFCDFDLMERAPDYSVFSKIRKKLGINLLSRIFAVFRDQLSSKGYMSEVFTFVDATHLISKASLWELSHPHEVKHDKAHDDVDKKWIAASPVCDELPISSS